MKLLTLYKKTHRKTGLKYLGYTSRDPFSYTGSGKYWSRHLKKVRTEHFKKLAQKRKNDFCI
jgi:hypothetical protein